MLAADEAWLLSDANDAELLAAGWASRSTRGATARCPVELLVGRAWFRYAPLGRVGRIRASP